MKANVLRFVMSIMFVLMCLVLSFKSAKAEEVYIAEVCFQVFDDVGAPDWIYKFGVYQKEGNHFALYGTDSFTEAAHGNLELLGSQIRMTIVGSGEDPFDSSAWSETFSAILDLSTLSGTYHVLGMESNSVGGVDLFHDHGTIGLTTCP